MRCTLRWVIFFLAFVGAGTLVDYYYGFKNDIRGWHYPVKGLAILMTLLILLTLWETYLKRRKERSARRMDSPRPDVFDLDPMLSRMFKTAPDGHKVFFPLGPGRGYTIASEQDYRRLGQQLKVLWVAVFLLGILLVYIALQTFLYGSAILIGYVILALPALIFLPLPYFVWLGYWLCRLQPSDEKYETMSLEDWAHLNSAWTLWLMEIITLAFVSCGIIAFILDPGTWPLALAALFIFGPVAALVAYMLVLRRRPVRTRS
jgi:hypothetical protein